MLLNSPHIPYEQLISYAAKELDEFDAEAASIDAHISICNECAGTVSRYRTLRALVYSDFSQDPPPSTVTRAHAIFREERAQAKSSQHVPYEQLIAYAAKAMNDREMAEADAHISTCDECIATVSLYGMVRRLVRSDFSQAPPDSTVARAHSIFRKERVQAKQPSRPWLSIFEIFRSFARPVAWASASMIVLAIALILGQVVVASANDAIPGDVLYPVKINVEALQVMTAFGKDAQAHAYLDIARKRVDEVAVLNEKRRYAYIQSTLTAYEDATQQVVTLVGELSTQDADRAAVLGAEANDNISKHIAVLAALEAKVPNQAKSAIAHAITMSENGALTVEEKVQKGKKGKPAQTLTGTPTPTPTATRTRPGEPPGLQGTRGPFETPPGRLVTPGVPPPKDDTPGPPGPPPSKTPEPSKTPNELGPPPSKTPEPSKTPNAPEPPPSKTPEPSKTPNAPGPPPSKTPEPSKTPNSPGPPPGKVNTPGPPGQHLK